MRTGKIPVVPGSGIGKSLGAVAREAAYILTEDLGRKKRRSSPCPRSSWATGRRNGKSKAARPSPSTAASSNAPPRA